MQYELICDTCTLTYTVIPSHRRKTIEITVRRTDGILVRVPAGIDIDTIQQWVDTKKAWIFGVVQKYNLHNVRAKGELSSVQYLGEDYRLHIELSHRNAIHIQEEIISIRTKEITQEYVRHYLMQWLRTKAEYIFSRAYNRCLQAFLQFCRDFLPQQKLWYGVYHATVDTFIPPTLRIYPMKCRYGSLRQSRILTLSTQLIHAPIECIEYVLFHELSHIIEFNHSPQFYAILSHLCPQWKEYNHWLHTELTVF